MLSWMVMLQLYCAPLDRLPTKGVLPPPVGSVPHVMDVVELVNPFEFELLPGICQMVPMLPER